MKLIKARPTLYKGIQMRSRLEADFAAALDRRGIEWEYEPTCFAGPEGQWLPDFRSHTKGVRTYVELKPAYLLVPQGSGFEEAARAVDRIDEILQKMSIARLSEPDVMLQLVFWQYGDASYHFCIYQRPGEPWCAAGEATPLYSLWPGMGQIKALCASRQEAKS